jgi:two-component system nitrate/nitrite response regulator NarL
MMLVFTEIAVRGLADFVGDALGPLGHRVVGLPDNSSEPQHQRGDVLIVDLHTREMAGNERVRSVRARFDQMPLLVLETGLQAPDRAHMLDAGADAILRFPCAPVELIAYVHALGRQRDAARQFAAASVLARLPQVQLATLSKREREVLRLLAHGHTDQQIASALLIAVRTARFHVGSILRKCAAVNRAQAAVYGALFDLLQVEFAAAA